MDVHGLEPHWHYRLYSLLGREIDIIAVLLFVLLDIDILVYKSGYNVRLQRLFRNSGFTLCLPVHGVLDK